MQILVPLKKKKENEERKRLKGNPKTIYKYIKRY